MTQMDMAQLTKLLVVLMLVSTEGGYKPTDGAALVSARTCTSNDLKILGGEGWNNGSTGGR